MAVGRGWLTLDFSPMTDDYGLKQLLKGQESHHEAIRRSHGSRAVRSWSCHRATAADAARRQRELVVRRTHAHEWREIPGVAPLGNAGRRPVPVRVSATGTAHRHRPETLHQG